MEFKKFIDIKTAIERARVHKSNINPDKLPKYYLPYFDDVLFCFAPSELTIIGADTGQGKSWMANHIALENACRGKNVYMFSLEGHETEVVSRWKWNIILREYFLNPNGKDMTFTKYQNNLIKGIEELESIAEKELESMIGKNLMLFDRSASMDIDLLSQQLGLITDADLVIIDHLHYFDMIDDTNEAKHLSAIMKRIKVITEENNIPVCLVSHLRKKMGQRGLPDNEDFMGTSNIPKIASTCLLLSADPKNHKLADNKYSTVFRVSKSRAGASTTLAARVMFDAREQKYEGSYTLGKVISGEFKELEIEEVPYWAKPKKEKDLYD